jgi:hypothetical protein
MSLSTTGRAVQAKRRAELTRVENQKAHRAAADKYNHLRVQFSDGSEQHLLFTDKQIERAIKRASSNLEDLPKISWVREFWFEGLIETGIGDVQEVINQKKLPAAANKYNHLRVKIGSEDFHFLFTDNDILLALNRAKKNIEDLPKVSWLSNILD